jgi:hypothetical protein
LRDIQRSILAVEKQRQSWKRLEKDRRETLVLLERAHKSQFALHYYDEEEIQSQSGLFTAGLAAVGVASAAVAAGSMAAGTAAVTKSLKRTEETINRAATSAGDILESVKGFVQSVRDSFGAYWLIPVGLGLFAICTMVASMPFVWNAIVVLAQNLFGAAWKWLSGYFSLDRVESQSGLTEDVSFFATLAAVLLVPSKDPKIMVGEITRRISSFDRTQSGLNSIFEKGLKYVELCINAILSIFTDKRMDVGDSSERLLKAWAKKVDDFESLCVAGNPSLKELRGAVLLMQEGIGFRQMLKSVPALTFVNRKGRTTVRFFERDETATAKATLAAREKPG